MKKIGILFFGLLGLFLLISCKENPVAQVPQTPAIRGSVSIPKGSGLTGSDFFVRVMEGEKAVYTGKASSDGTFAVSGLKEDVSYSLLLTTEEPGDIKASEKDISRAGTSGYGGWLSNVSAAVAEDANIGSVKVKPLGTIKGVVTKDGAEDGYDTTVYIPGTSYLAMTDGEGNFSIFNVPQATYTLRFISSGYMAKMVDNVVLFSESDTVNPEITVATQKLIRNVGSIEGFAVRDGEIDNSGITLRLEQENSTVNLSATTATNGYFRIDEVPPGTYRVLASYAGYLSQASGYVSVTAANLTSVAEKLELAQNIGTINGSVSLSGSTQKGGINISITGLDSERRYSAVTTEDGTFRRNVSSGRYEVTAFYPGYNGNSTEVSVMQGMSVQVDLGALASAYGTVSGRIVLEGSVDASGVVVTITDSLDSSRHYSTVTDAQGTYLITGIASAGSYLIECTKDGYLKNNSSSVSVSMGVVSSAGEITMKSLTSKITGSASLEGSEDFTGISILLKAKDNSIQYDATTDQKGSYVMARVNPGEYTLTVSKAGYVSKTVEGIIVESSTEKELDEVFLSVGVRSVTGTVTAELKTDHSGTLITATNLSDQKMVYSAISNSSGTYTIAGMVPGEYQIVISHTGYRTLTLPTVNVTEGSTKALDAVEIEINRGTISGVATLEGRTSSEGIKIELLQGSTVVETKNTNAAGEYSFYVPQGNYSGVRMTMTDFRTETVSESIALFADNYISIENTELKATANSVYGTADVLTTDDDSNVTVSFDGHDEILAVTTEEDGAFRFDHIPLGNYSLRFQRENCSDIIVPVSVVPSDGIDLNTVTITPNTATITGKVNLENGSSLAGVLVSVDMGTKTVTGYTDASGRYEVGGISVADTYTVTYIKDGWVSNSQSIGSALERLEKRELSEISLVDTTVPVLSKVVINSGANTAADRHVTLHFTCSDLGSGIAKVMITYDNIFDRTVTRHDYLANMELDLPSGNGEKIIYVKVVDAAGNESNTVTASVTLTDQKKEVSGVLTGDDLHWTEAQSPYLVTGNIMVEEGKTLVVDPGVDVQFAGDYYIQVEGILTAIGTREKKILFYGTGDDKNWSGINAVTDCGSMIRYALISDMIKGIQGQISVWDSEIVGSEYSLGSNSYTYSGEFRNSIAVGRINTKNAYLVDSRIESQEGNLSKSYLAGMSFSNSQINIANSVAENSQFSNSDVFSSRTGMLNVSFINCNTWLRDGGIYLKCLFSDCSFGTDRFIAPFSPAIIRNSNLIGSGSIKIFTGRSDIEEIDLRGNFWGYDKTRELDDKGPNSNLSFIDDYYDDFNITKADLSDYKTDPIEGVGYLGESYYPDYEESEIEYDIGEIGPAGGIIFYDKGYYSEGWRYLEAAPSDFGDGNSYVFGLYRATDDSSILTTGTLDLIGSGSINTYLLREMMGTSAYNSMIMDGEKAAYAARVCYELAVDGYEDWFLPSKEELYLMYYNLKRNGLGNFNNVAYGFYWSSSEVQDRNNCSWLLSMVYGTFNNGTSSDLDRDNGFCVRPIRRF